MSWWWRLYVQSSILTSVTFQAPIKIRISYIESQQPLLARCVKHGLLFQTPMILCVKYGLLFQTPLMRHSQILTRVWYCPDITPANMGPTWADRTQGGHILAPWTVQSGKLCPWAHVEAPFSYAVEYISRLSCHKGPYLPCVSMAGRALLAGYHRYQSLRRLGKCWTIEYHI